MNNRMSLIKYAILAAGAVAVSVSTVVNAATVNNPSTAVPQVYGKNIANESVRSVVSPVATAVTLGAGEALNVDDSITFTLSGGATFAAIAAGDLTVAPNVAGATFALVAGGVGENFATYRVTTANTDAAAVLTLAATATHNDASVAANGSVTTTVTMKGFVGGSAIDLFGSPLVSLSEKLVPSFTAGLAPSPVTGTFDVATNFTQLTAATSSDGAAPFNSSNATVLTVTPNAATAVGNNTAGVPAAVPAVGKLLVKISGSMAGVQSITTTVNAVTTVTGATSATAVGGVPTGGTVANSFFIDAVNNEAYAILTGAFTAGTGEALNVFLNFDGTTVQQAKDYTAEVKYLGDANFSAHSIANNIAAASFGRNGSSFTSNSIGPLNKVTVTDRSGSIGTGGGDGAISVSGYAEDGTAVACSLTIPNLTANGSVAVQGQDIVNSCPGIKRIEGVVNSTSILVTNVKKSADGISTVPAVVTSGGTGAQ